MKIWNFNLRKLRKNKKQRLAVAVPGIMTTRRELAPTEGADGYENLLPRFQGKVITELIEEALKSSTDISILDIGCGEALFLARVLEKFPSVHTAGISAADYRSRIVDSELSDLVSRVDYKVGDAHGLASIYQGKKFNFITSVETFQDITDSVSVLKQAYELLEKGGIMFIQDPKLPLRFAEVDLLVKYWRDKGLKFEIIKLYTEEQEERLKRDKFFTGFPRLGVAIQKGDIETLPLPFKLRQPTDDFWSYFELDQSKLT